MLASVLNDTGRYNPAMALVSAPQQTHRVAVLVVDTVPSFEVGVAAEVFALARPELDVPWWYGFALCAEHPGPMPAVGGYTVAVPHGLDAVRDAGTVILPGCDVHGTPSEAVVSALRDAHGRGARLVSICSGAFVLAATGLLDGRRVATHWRYAELLQARHPALHVDASVLYVDDGSLLTSAGTAAGIDLCLHLVRRDHGADIANRVARRMVIAPARNGGQAQFIETPVPARVAEATTASVMDWAAGQLDKPLSVVDMARQAHLSVRQFTRRFRAATGSSPARWLLEQRVAASLPLLERSDNPVEQIAAAVGFPTAASFRRHFRDAVGVAPSAYRRSFLGGP
jgi:AraC family transcriptional regulator, transcriptional activator FtrA